MLFKSQLLGVASGSLGAMTAARNKGGQYMRNRSLVTNPNTARQQIIRTALGTLSQLWNTLTQVERDAWAVYASNVPRTNPLGDSTFISGQNWFLGNNTARIQLGLTPVTAAPTIFNQGEPVTEIASAVTVLGATNTVTVNWAAPLSAAAVVAVYVGLPQNEGKKYYKGPYQYAAKATVLAAATTAAPTADINPPPYAPGDWQSDYAAAVGQRTPFRIVTLFNDGRISQALKLTVVWT